MAGNHTSESVKIRHSPLASENLTNNQLGSATVSLMLLVRIKMCRA